MNPLLEVFEFLADEVQSDPLLALINAVVWLDPLWDNDGEDEYDGDDLGRALEITRHSFTDVYAGAISLLRAGAHESEIDGYICREIEQKGIPLESIEFMGAGIPLEAAGVILKNPYLYSDHAGLVPIVELFGIHVDGNEGDEEEDEEMYRDDDDEFEDSDVFIPQGAHEVGRAIASSLANLDEQDNPEWDRVGWLMQWLFSCSGNTLIDCTLNDLMNMEPMGWNRDDVDLATEMIAEVNPIMISVRMGIELLQNCPDMMQTLARNIARVTRALKKEKDDSNGSSRSRTESLSSRLRLEWTAPLASDSGETVDDPELLQLRSDAA